jgi:hypothetical protein
MKGVKQMSNTRKRGRPRNKTESINVCVTVLPELKKRMDGASQKYKTSLCGITRMALEDWLATQDGLMGNLTMNERLEAFGTKIIRMALVQSNLVKSVEVTK